jgi:hypothetical protein
MRAGYPSVLNLLWWVVRTNKIPQCQQFRRGPYTLNLPWYNFQTISAMTNPYQSIVWGWCHLKSDWSILRLRTSHIFKTKVLRSPAGEALILWPLHEDWSNIPTISTPFSPECDLLRTWATRCNLGVGVHTSSDEPSGYGKVQKNGVHAPLRTVLRPGRRAPMINPYINPYVL